MIERVAERGGPLTTNDVVGVSVGLRTLGAEGVGDDVAAGLVEQIRVLEELKSAAAAAQARVTARFAAGQRAVRRAAGVPARDVGKGIAAQVALARRDSPCKGSRHLGLAEALVGEMPHTMAALEAGQLSEWRATVLVRETACLSRQHRSQVDAELAARPGGLGELGDRAVAVEARRIGYRLDPHAVTDRARKAESERRVTLRPAPDTMSLLSGLLPARQGVAAYAALTRHADSRRAEGDVRSRGQIMADTLVERITGQTTAPAVAVQVNLVMTDQTLLGDDPEPVDLDGYGPIPAPLVRDWLRGDQADDADRDDHQDRTVEQVKVWLRRLYTDPDTGGLVAMDSTRRCFAGALRRFLILRDRRCRTPWCDAPIRHLDHPVPVTDGGPTTAANSQGLCEACNYTKQAPDWRTRLRDDGAVVTTTPTGHRYLSRPPPTVGRPPPGATAPAIPSRLEAHFHDLVLAC